MAVSVVSFTQSTTSWFDSVNPKTTASLAWSSGDVIVVGVIGESGDINVAAPTNANLTFTQRIFNDQSDQETQVYVYTAVAGSAQTGQTISVDEGTATGFHWGFATWVLTGTAGTFANATNNQTESTITITPSSGSGVLYIVGDWNADATNQTIATGTGTATERVDSAGTQYGVYLGDWMGVTASSTAFGVTSYTGLKVNHALLEVLASAASTVGGVFPTPQIGVPFTGPGVHPTAKPLQLLGDASGSESKALDDTATDTETVTVAAAAPLADTAAAADAAVVAAAVPMADTAAAAETDPTVLAAIPMADTAAADDSLSVLIAATVSPDQAPSRIPGLLLNIRFSAGQIYGDAATPAGVQAITLTETAAGADSVTVAAAITLADTAAGDDALALAAAVPMSETGAGDDSLSVINTPPSDPYQFTPAIAWMFASPRSSSTQNVGDTTSPINMPDTATGTDDLTLVIAVPLAETATATDAAVVAAVVTLTETAAATDTLAPAVAVPLDDTATASDSLSVQVLGAADAYQAMPQQRWRITRPGVAVEPPAMQLLGDASGSTQINLTDTATAADSLTISVAVVMTETAAGADALANSAAVPLSELVAAADSLALAVVVILSESLSGSDVLDIGGTRITGNVYPHSGGSSGNAYPRGSGQIIGSVR